MTELRRQKIVKLKAKRVKQLACLAFIFFDCYRFWTLAAFATREPQGLQMKFVILSASLIVGLGLTTAAFAGDEYNTVPAGDAQFASCLKYSATVYQGGDDASPIKGQTKAQAWCTCMWNETPDDFKGSLAKFSETSKGKSTNDICEKYADWH